MPDQPVPGLPVALAATSSRPSDVRYARGLVSGLLQMPPETRPRLTLIVASGQAYFSERRQKIRVITMSNDPHSSAGLRELSHVVRQLDPAVLHCTDLATPRPRVKIPLVTTLRDLAPLVVEDPQMPAAARRAFLQACKRAAKTSQALIAVSHQMADDATRLFPAAPDKLTVIPKAADDLVSGGKQLMPDLLYRLPPTQFFLALGDSKPSQGLSTLLRAFERFFQQASALPGFDALACPRLLLLGKDRPGYLSAQLSGPVAELVHFTNQVDDEELRWLYAHTLAFVAPSRHESFGLSALEAASFATPVLAAHAGALPEVFGEGEGAGAAYFAPDDSEELAALLLRIARDQDFVDALSAAAYARAGLFSWRASAQATLALYQQLT